jgi:geranylgeranyl pyrophosphate synthase
VATKQVNTSYFEKSYITYIENAKRIFDFDISQTMSKVADFGLGEKIKYVLRTRGKRLRPIMVLLSAQSVGGRIETVRKLALAIEMLHIASLIHDDILDQDTLRRNELTANIKWGIRDAVLIGDALASLSFYLSADYENEIMKIISQTSVKLSDGEYMDVKESRYTRKESEYIETIRKKLASLFKASTQCGAIAAKGKRNEIEVLSEFGENFGLAYQIKDDLLDIIPIKDTIPQDIKMLRVTLPIIHLLESTKPEEREELVQAITTINTQNLNEKENTTNMLREHLEITGSLRYCANKIDQYITKAIASLEPLKESPFRGYLIDIANSLKLK